MRMPKKEKAKKVIETFRIVVDRKLSSIEKRGVEEQIKILIKELNGKV